jgi:hypothetical protein
VNCTCAIFFSTFLLIIRLYNNNTTGNYETAGPIYRKIYNNKKCIAVPHARSAHLVRTSADTMSAPL